MTPLVVEVMPGGKRFRLHYDFRYYWKWGGIEVCVPAGFETDFASIPRIFRNIIPKLGRWNKAAVLHDWIYQNHIVKKTPQISFIFNRLQADIMFRDAMRDLGVVKWKRGLMYLAVRLGGQMAWRRR